MKKKKIEQIFEEANKEIGHRYPFLTSSGSKEEQEMVDKYNKVVYYFFKVVLNNTKIKILNELKK